MTTWLDWLYCWGEIERCSSPATSSLKSLSLIHSKPLNSAKIQRTLQRSSSIRPQFALNPQESSSGQYNLVRGGGLPSNCQNISTVKIPPWLGPSNVWQYVTLYHAGTEQCRSYTECITRVWSRRNDTLWHNVRGSVARGEWRTMEDIPRLRHPLPSHLIPSRSHASNLLDLLLHLIVFKWLLVKSISTRWVACGWIDRGWKKADVKDSPRSSSFSDNLTSLPGRLCSISRERPTIWSSHDNLTHICPPRPERPTTAQDFLFSMSRGEHYPVSTAPGTTIASTRLGLPGN